MRAIMLSALSSVLLLSGCGSIFKNANVAEDFDCPVQEGFGCRSIADIRSQIVTSGQSVPAVYNTASPDVSLSGVPKWRSDVLLKVHIGDYIDSHGDYHDESVIYVVAMHGGWETK